MQIPNCNLGWGSMRMLAGVFKDTLVVLDVLNNKIQDRGAQSLTQLTRLQTLSLSGCYVSAAGAAFIGKLTTLCRLDLPFNRIADEGCLHLTNLSHLRVLNISATGVTWISIQHLTCLIHTLQKLDVSNNDFEQPGDAALAIAQLTGLTSLRWDTYIGDEEHSLTTTTALSTLKQLQQLCLENHDGLEADPARSLAGLAALSALTSVNLAEVAVNTSASQGVVHLSNLTGLQDLVVHAEARLSPALPRLTTLITRLDVSYGGGVSRQDVMADVSALTRLRDLVVLSCGGVAYAVFQMSNLINLTHLILPGRLGGAPYGVLGASESKGLGKFTNLQSLDVSGLALCAAGAAALTRLTKLTCLSFAIGRLSAAGAAEVATLQNLVRLDISDGVADIGVLAELTTLTKLTFLNVSNNLLGPVEAASLGDLRSLVALNVNVNELGAAGAAALTSLTRLTKLEIREDGLGAGGALALISLTKLQWLDLSNNGIDVAVAFRVAAALPQLHNYGVGLSNEEDYVAIMRSLRAIVPHSG